MADRHIQKKRWGDHPPTCTCESCDAMRRGAEDPKQVRSRKKRLTSASALGEALDILNRSAHTQGDSPKRIDVTESPGTVEAPPPPNAASDEFEQSGTDGSLINVGNPDSPLPNDEVAKPRTVSGNPSQPAPSRGTSARSHTPSSKTRREQRAWEQRAVTTDRWIARVLRANRRRNLLRNLRQESIRFVVAVLIGAAIAVLVIFPLLPSGLQQEVELLQERITNGAGVGPDQ